MPQKAEHHKYLYNTAKAIAKLYHFGQFDKAGEKTIAHVRAVVHNVMEDTVGMDADFIIQCCIVAWLHDTAEDGPTVVPTFGILSTKSVDNHLYTPDREEMVRGTYAAIESLFGNAVLDAVDLLTHNPDVSYRTYIDIIERSGNRVAIYVKLADLKNNMNRDRVHRLYESCPDEKDRVRYAKKQEQYAEAVKILTKTKLEIEERDGN